MSLDRFINGFDTALRTLAGVHQAQRPRPDCGGEKRELTALEQKHSAGLMRINHCGEVCAQALYQGQALTASDPKIAEALSEAAKEEIDHLKWCEQRLQELGAQPTLLNPLWYGMSFSLGAVAGLLGDKWSLGFLAATEDQVCRHLHEHLQSISENDGLSRATIAQMAEDEANHSALARREGAQELPKPIKDLMWEAAKIMKESAYRF